MHSRVRRLDRAACLQQRLATHFEQASVTDTDQQASLESGPADVLAYLPLRRALTLPSCLALLLNGKKAQPTEQLRIETKVTCYTQSQVLSAGAAAVLGGQRVLSLLAMVRRPRLGGRRQSCPCLYLLYPSCARQSCSVQG